MVAGTAVRVGPTALAYDGRSRFGVGRWTYVPFTVPPGVRRITVRTSRDRFTLLPGVLGNVLDVGIFGPAGRLRGWSGGARTWFTVAETDATPGYLAGPLDPGVWAVALGPVALNPLGMRWRVGIELEHGAGAPERTQVSAAPRVVADPGPGWYRGDLHLHSEHSDGRRTLDGLAADARAAGLHFVASTEHNTSSANRAWAADPPEDLLVLPGQEVTTRRGHWLAIGLPPDAWIDWRDPARFAEHARRVRDLGGLVVAAHPAVPLPTAAWELGYRHVDAIEVWNGHWNLDDEVALRVWHRRLCRGQRIAAVGGSDSHAPHQPVGRPQTEVRSSALTPAAIVEALRQGRSNLTESSAVTLRLSVTDDGAALATVTGAPGTTLTLITAAGRVARTAVGPSGSGRLGATRRSAADRFVRAEVRRAGSRRMVALSNPVWLPPGPGR